jgi:hypothetical protein
MPGGAEDLAARAFPQAVIDHHAQRGTLADQGAHDHLQQAKAELVS